MITKPKPPSRHKLLTSPFAALVVGVGFYGAAWGGGAYVLQSQAERWIAAQQQAGRNVTHGELKISGFPGSVQIALSDWSMSTPITDGGWTWRTSSLRLWTQPWTLGRFTVDLAGSHTLSGAWSDLPFTITADRADLQPALSLDGQIDTFDVNINKLSVGGANDAPSLAAIESGALSIHQVDPAKSNDAPIWRLSFNAAKASVIGMEHFGVLAPAIETIRFTLDLVGALNANPLLTALAAWREGGGTVELRELALDWPPLSVAASGTLALDENLQPIGALSAKFQGFFETVDAMTTHGVVRASDASMARIVLGLMAREPVGGGTPELNLAVTVQNRKLYTGPISLMTMPEVVWPEDIVLP
ncbi:MAG: DUF2125 domain-containing protein [Alphaproteobacteria bacterium]|nr:DUF2125 domain-containing protein [Alphaproteobacteria bacterium]PHX99250.1 MAG: hypothetical protein CK529_09690 [Rhodospirillaceae bacterium]